MRKPIYVILMTMTLAATLCWQMDYQHAADYYTLLGREMDQAWMDTYTDPDYGYLVSYPGFFRRDTLVTDIGHATFRYEDRFHSIVVDSFVVSDTQRTWKHTDTHTEWGQLTEHGGRIDGYRHLTRRVRRGNLWYVCALYYPERCGPALNRLINMIRGWDVKAQPRLSLREKFSETSCEPSCRHAPNGQHRHPSAATS